MTGPPAQRSSTDQPTGGVDAAWRHAAQRAVGATLVALVEERDQLRTTVEQGEPQRARLEEADRLLARRSVRLALGLSRAARRRRVGSGS